jgi:hypothetical protein
MKYVLMLLAVAVIYFLIARQAPVAPAVETITASEAAPLTTGPRDPSPATANSSTALKRPLDKTHAVLDQVKKRNGDGEF